MRRRARRNLKETGILQSTKRANEVAAISVAETGEVSGVPVMVKPGQIT